VNVRRRNGVRPSHVRPVAVGRAGRARFGVAALALLLLCGFAGCTLPAPAGTAPLRYRDAVFSNVTTTSGLTYGSAPDASGNPVTLTLDLYQPTGDTQTSRPAIVLVHGGSFVGGTSQNASMVRMAKAFAQRGYVAVSINYRLLGTGERCGQQDPPSQACVTAVLAAQHDAQAAVRWLRKNATTYGVDPSRVAIGGGSAGAGTALAVAVNSGDPGTSGNPGYSSKVGAAISISGGFPHSVASTYYDPSDSPILMFNGTADQVVPFQASVQTAADLYNAKVPIVFEPLQGAGHVPFATEGDLMISQSVYFCYFFLDLAHAAGQPASAAGAFDRQARQLLRQNPSLSHSLKRG
jgi:dienelactone hydrolase